MEHYTKDNPPNITDDMLAVAQTRNENDRSTTHVFISDVWQHRKSTHLYVVTGFTLLQVDGALDMTPCVLYKRANGSADQTTWCRPLADFARRFERRARA